MRVTVGETIQGIPDITPLYCGAVSWGGGESKYCITGNFRAQTLIGGKGGWRYISILLHLHLHVGR